ncbi:hypothetical protein [Saccharopolyspora taberi]|uniref:Uncharacterized protein n=1 Tax=Saccharopolyspora taberi TaxID=60895 RepID=A0ABN3VBW9_9PSEU
MANDASPTDGTAIRHAVLDHLDLLDRTAAEGCPEELLPVARTGLHLLAEGLRALLDAHRPDQNGRCPTCPGLLRGRQWPCAAWLAAHRRLLGDRPRALLRAPHPEPPAESAIEVRPPVVATTGDNGPGDWNTDEFPVTDPDPAPPPIGGHLETDHTKIYRAAVSDRPIRWPRLRLPLR